MLIISIIIILLLAHKQYTRRIHPPVVHLNNLSSSMPLERLDGRQKVEGSIPVWGLEYVFVCK